MAQARGATPAARGTLQENTSWIYELNAATERESILCLRAQGCGIRKIAGALNRSPSGDQQGTPA
ncbi:helix-turn-helix domain-containing protein [Desulfobulbus oralis]|uniref:helix-turn-helix domain-containing protein n=1 Tax=Desulfobulbus oralis TaxID=1986146 RepID=UPI003CCB77BB